MPEAGAARMDDRTGVLPAYSIEVLPRTLAALESLSDCLPAGTRVYVAHIEGTPFEAMLAAARRIEDEGYRAMPHLPARLLPDRDSLVRWVGRYREEAGVTQALVLAGGMAAPRGPYASSMDLLDSGVFDRFGYERLHLAAHPEGSRALDPDGGTAVADQALLDKQGLAMRTDAQLALVTQFGFDARALVDWCLRVAAMGVRLPIHVGVAGPARLPSLLKYALACGVGPSMRVLQQRASDLTRLVRLHEPTDYLAALAARVQEAASRGQGGLPLAQWHVFPFGGIEASARWFNAALGLQAKAQAGAPCLS